MKTHFVCNFQADLLLLSITKQQEIVILLLASRDLRKNLISLSSFYVCSSKKPFYLFVGQASSAQQSRAERKRRKG